MREKVIRPNVDAILSKLKDFQRQSVEYVFRRMYLDPDATRRFLIADEVGLGKTLVARGVIARVIDHLWDQVRRIDIVYICSNADIARQNINRLNVAEERRFTFASRITLLPTQIDGLMNNNLNFISFTPGTSFELKSRGGRYEERALLYWMLREAWNFRGTGALNLLQGLVGDKNRFRQYVDEFRDQHKKRVGLLAPAFAEVLKKCIAKDNAAGQPDIRTRFAELCDRFGYARKNIPDSDRRARDALIGDLRMLLATTCIQALEPDLIILDEFQRFKHLLEPSDDASRLAHDLFEYGDSRILLLSATPYKMYTLAQEAATDDHYKDFVRTMSFLQNEPVQAHEFEQLLRDYRREILRFADGDLGRLLEIKGELETRMRRVMVRTERLAVSQDRNGMLANVSNDLTQVEPQDLLAYTSLQRVARALNADDTLEYWKSAPYLLSFMEGYKLKLALEKATAEQQAQLGSALHNGVLLDWSKITAYERIDPANARLRALIADTIENGAWQLLWVPPSLPYYQLGGPFASPELQQFTKRLVFSSWQVVPKTLASLLSYEVERRIVKSFDETAENRPDAPHRRTRLLHFGRNDDRLTGLPLISLVYPSTILATRCDPLSIALSARRGDEPPTLVEVLHLAAARVSELLSRIEIERKESNTADEAWYWAAPILIDLAFDPVRTSEWLARPRLAGIWSGGIISEEDGADSRWAEHVQHVQQFVTQPWPLGPQPDDLPQVLALQAVAGLANGALRALSRVCRAGSTMQMAEVRDSAAQLAWSLLQLFNLPEATALLRGRDRREPYWQRVLEYCADGGLQSMLDEYAHVLRDSLGLFDATPQRCASEVSETMRKALSLRTATLRVDEVTEQDANVIVTRERRMRVRYALRFGNNQADGNKELNRAEHVRESFNSPFWPFVLTTTSVGQEGLDFHSYCHAVVHWNLPSNPVDLEQREGRVHRYKCHAVRRNVALRYGLRGLQQPDGDPWEQLFDLAKRERPSGDSDLVPFWVFAVEGGAKIKRYVLSVPLSREVDRFAALSRSLAVYRMVFGQPRQDDLLTFLLGRLPESQIEQLAAELRIDLSPPRPAVI